MISNGEVKIIGRTPIVEDLEMVIPENAADYYAYHQTTSHRVQHDILLLKNAYLTVDYTRGYRYHFTIHDKKGRLVLPHLQEFDCQIQESCIRIEERVAFLDDRYTRFNICHFLFDKLWRASCLEEYDPDTYLVLFRNNYVDDALQLLKLNPSSITEVPGKIVTYEIRELLFSTSTFEFEHPGNNFSPVLEHKLKCLDSNSATHFHNRRYFVDRRDAKSRRVLNMDAIEPILLSRGIELLCLNSKTLREQIEIFRNVELIVGVHGAGLANAWFSKVDSMLLFEILPPLCATADYWKLAMAKGINYDAYIARDAVHPKPDYNEWIHQPEKYNRRDVIVDTMEFERILDENMRKAGLCS